MVTLEGRNTVIQAFPVNQGTFIGTASALDISSRLILHCLEDNTLTFTFHDGSTLQFDAAAGSDFSIGNGCATLDSTANVLVS